MRVLLLLLLDEYEGSQGSITACVEIDYNNIIAAVHRKIEVSR